MTCHILFNLLYRGLRLVSFRLPDFFLESAAEGVADLVDFVAALLDFFVVFFSFADLTDFFFEDFFLAVVLDAVSLFAVSLFDEEDDFAGLPSFSDAAATVFLSAGVLVFFFAFDLVFAPVFASDFSAMFASANSCSASSSAAAALRAATRFFCSFFPLSHSSSRLLDPLATSSTKLRAFLLFVLTLNSTAA